MFLVQCYLFIVFKTRAMLRIFWAHCVLYTLGFSTVSNFEHPEKILLVLEHGWMDPMQNYSHSKIVESPGRSFNQFPIILEAFSDLELLALPGGLFPTLPAFMYEKKQLRVLDFYYANLIKLEEGFGDWPLMVSLQMEYNEFSTLPESLGNMTNLRVLNLKGVRLKTMPESFHKMRKLNFVHISAAHEDLVQEIAPHLLGILEDDPLVWAHYLVKQNLFVRNGISSSVPKPRDKYKKPVKGTQVVDGRLDLTLLNSSKLSEVLNPLIVNHLYLSYNQLEHLPSALESFIALQYLDLGVNQLTEFPQELQILTSLQEVSISSNLIQEIPSGVQLPDSLKILDLSSNQIDAFPSALKTCKSLEKLDLSGNQIHEIKLEDLRDFRDLKELSLFGNPIPLREIQKLRVDFPRISILYSANKFVGQFMQNH